MQKSIGLGVISKRAVGWHNNTKYASWGYSKEASWVIPKRPVGVIPKKLVRVIPKRPVGVISETRWWLYQRCHLGL